MREREREFHAIVLHREEFGERTKSGFRGTDA